MSDQFALFAVLLVAHRYNRCMLHQSIYHKVLNFLHIGGTRAFLKLVFHVKSDRLDVDVLHAAWFRNGKIRLGDCVDNLITVEFGLCTISLNDFHMYSFLGHAQYLVFVLLSVWG